MNRFIVSEPSKCIGCRTCEVACVLAHVPGGAVEGMTAAGFAPRLHVVRTREISVPVTCRHCEDAPCLNACPSGAIFYSDESVQVNQSLCLGCKTCVVACPFGAMDVVTVPAQRGFAGVMVSDGARAEAHKCDLCHGREAGPACIEVCPTDALHVMSEAWMDEVRRVRQERAAVAVGMIG